MFDYGSSLFRLLDGVAPQPPAHISIAPQELRLSLAVVPSIRIEGTTARLRGVPQDGRVRGWVNRGQWFGCLGGQAGFRWIAERWGTSKEPAPRHRLARDHSGEPSNPSIGKIDEPPFASNPRPAAEPALWKKRNLLQTRRNRCR